MPEVLSMRERLCARVVRMVLDEGERLSNVSAWREALAIYERGILIDPWVEASYQGIMRCHYAMGDRVEARRAYERCRAALKSRFDLDPSRETQALLRQD